MTQVVVNLTDTFEQWRVKTNQVCENQGDIATLTTTDKDSLVDAINEIDSNNQATGDVVDDTSPQLGANLDVNGKSIISVSNGNIAITPNGSGKIILDGLSHPTADGTAGQFLQTNGSGVLSFGALANNSVNGAMIALGSDAAGDTMYYNGTDYVRLPKGTADQVLQINAGATAPEWTSDLKNIVSGDTVPATKVNTLSNGTIDCSDGEYFKITLSGNITFSFTNVPSGFPAVVLEITNGGNHTVTWPAAVKWTGGVAPTLTSSGVDILVFTTDDTGTTWRSSSFSLDNK